MTTSDFSRLITHLYNGHVEEDPYSSFLKGMRDMLDLNFAFMTIRKPTAQDGGLLFVSGDVLFVSDDQLGKTYIDARGNSYIDQYYASDLMTNLPWGEVRTMDEMISHRLFEESDLYTLCMKPLNLYHMLGVDLRNVNGQRFTIRLCRAKKSNNFNAEDREFLSMVAPHIQRAVSGGMQLIQIDNERKLFSNTISGLSIGIITLDERAKIISCNRLADELLGKKDGVSIINDRLHIHNIKEKKQFNQYINEVIDSQRNQEPIKVNAISIERPLEQHPLEILIKPLAIDKTSEPNHSPHLMLFISDPDKKHDIDVDMLISIYKLTRAEAMLTKHLVAGETLDQSANQLGIARNTARAQLRAIFSKTGVTQQSMLVSLILKSLVSLS